MKNPAYALLLTALLSSPGTLAFAQDHDGDGRVGFRDSVREAWYQLEDAGYEVKEKIYEGVQTVKAASRHVRHERPLLTSEYVTAVKNGDKVVLVYCNSRAFRLADRQACEKLHSKSFKVSELKSCLASAGDNKQPGLILNRQLTAAEGSEYGYDFFKMYDSKESYKEYLKSCQESLANAKPARNHRPVAVAPSREQPEQAPAEFKPFEIQPAPSAQEQSDTL